MPTELEQIRDKGHPFLTTAQSYRIIDETSQKEASGLILRATERVQQIKKLGAVPIQAAKDNLATTKDHFDKIAAPFTKGIILLSATLGSYITEQRQAQLELQREEMQRASESGQAPEIVVGPEKTLKTDEGSVTVREVKTYDFGECIIDGKAVMGVDLSREMTVLEALPDHLFILDLPLLRKWALSGSKVDGLRVYTKPSISKRVSGL